VKLIWSSKAWGDYRYWDASNRRVRDKINALIEDIQAHPFTGLGKPESLKHDFASCWSRRITGEHRLVYRLKGSELQIIQCRYHY
jgi:toxin YoeB